VEKVVDLGTACQIDSFSSAESSLIWVGGARMSMGTRGDGKQPPILVETSEIARGEGQVFF